MSVNSCTDSFPWHAVDSFWHNLSCLWRRQQTHIVMWRWWKSGFSELGEYINCQRKHSSSTHASAVNLSAWSRWVVKFDCERKKGFSATFCGASWWWQSAAEGAPVCDQHIMERVRVIVLHNEYSILFSYTTTKESNSTPRAESAFLMSLLILLASTALSLLPQHTAAMVMQKVNDRCPCRK